LTRGADRSGRETKWKFGERVILRIKRYPAYAQTDEKMMSNIFTPHVPLSMRVIPFSERKHTRNTATLIGKAQQSTDSASALLKEKKNTTTPRSLFYGGHPNTLQNKFCESMKSKLNKYFAIAQKRE